MSQENNSANIFQALLGIILIGLGVYFIADADGFPFPAPVLYLLGFIFIVYGLYRFLPNLRILLNSFKK